MIPPSPSQRARVIGLTGSIAAGKSTVARLLAELGAAVVDVDALGHEVLARPDVTRRVADLLGDDVLTDEGDLDRMRVGKAVFADERLLADLEAIVHPLVGERARKLLHAARTSARIVVLDAALLFEGGLERFCDEVWFVDADVETRRRRTMETRGWSPDELDRRAARQLPVAEKRRRADVHLLNDDDLAALRSVVRAQFERIDLPDTGAGSANGRPTPLTEERV